MIDLDDYCKECKLLNKFCSCNRDCPPPKSYEVFADMVLAEALRTVEWYRAKQRTVGTPKMQLAAAKDIVRTARNVGILDWHKSCASVTRINRP